MKLTIDDYKKLASILDSNKGEFELLVEVMEYLNKKEIDLNDILKEIEEDNKDGKLSLKTFFFSRLLFKLGLNDLMNLGIK
ncbi:MAG: hypothetical protein ACPL1F_00030 [bacterium]|jgi:hypothetical protein